MAEAEGGDLKRVVELINRTNQWNLCATRTSFAQVRGWHDSKDASILLARAADRFGDLGTVCVAVVTFDAQEVQIPVFVLSCRVFGYGVETEMLKQIRHRFGVGRERSRLVGYYRASPQNHPGRAMYTDHGFAQDGDAFVLAGESALA